MSTHWAFELIGKPWEPSAQGPRAFDCQGLADCCCRMRFGEALPTLESVHASAWHRVEGPPQADDVVLMQGPEGRHIGWMVEADGHLGVLHADGHMTARGPVGCVCFHSLADATAGGYHHHEFWRRA